jgi:hypothetical protein
MGSYYHGLSLSNKMKKKSNKNGFLIRYEGFALEKFSWLR